MGTWGSGFGCHISCGEAVYSVVDRVRALRLRLVFGGRYKAQQMGISLILNACFVVSEICCRCTETNTTSPDLR